VSSFQPDVSGPVSSDPADTKFLHCAQAAQADYIVTGNKRHFSGRALWRDASLECR
jgi:predicted nucleic acid-binding protein